MQVKVRHVTPSGPEEARTGSLLFRIRSAEGKTALSWRLPVRTLSGGGRALLVL